MNVIVAAGVCLFDHDEARLLALRTTTALREQGHSAELMRLDAESVRSGSEVDQAAAVRSLRVDHAERLICLGWPSYMLLHPRKTVWLTCRSLCGGWLDAASSKDRSRLEQQEHEALGAAHRCFALSTTILVKAARYAFQDVQPLGLPSGFELVASTEPVSSPSDYVIVRWSRNPRARVDLAFLALARTQPPLRMLVICEMIRSSERDACYALACFAGVEKRVHMMFVAPHEERFLLSRAIGVLDLSQPGLSCGSWLDHAFSASTAIIVTGGGDMSDEAASRAKHLPCDPSIDEVAAALDALRHVDLPCGVTSPSRGTLAKPDWKQAIASLLS